MFTMKSCWPEGESWQLDSHHRAKVTSTQKLRQLWKPWESHWLPWQIKEGFIEEVTFFSDIKYSKGKKGNLMKRKVFIHLAILSSPGAYPRGSYSYQLLTYFSRDTILCSYEHTYTRLFFLTQTSSSPTYFSVPCFFLLHMYLADQLSLVNASLLHSL